VYSGRLFVWRVLRWQGLKLKRESGGVLSSPDSLFVFGGCGGSVSK
jgi:hypothetical protein